MKDGRRSVGKFWWLLVLAMTLVAGCRPEPSPEAAWSARVIAAHGGEEALRRLRTVSWQGEIEAYMRRARGTATLILQRPGRLRATFDYGSSREERILDGARGWRDAGEGFVEVQGAPLAAMVFQYKHLDLPLGLLDGGYRVTLREEERGGRQWPVLHLEDAEGPPMDVTVDPQTGLIAHVAGIFQVQGQTAKLEVDYGDYRLVAGVMLPQRIVNYAGGMAIAESRFARVEVNLPVDERTFRP